MEKKEIFASIEIADHEVRLVVGEFYDGRPYPVFCKSLDEDAGQYEKSDCRRSGRIRTFLSGGNFAAARGNHNGSASYACQQRDGGMRS